MPLETLLRPCPSGAPGTRRPRLRSPLGPQRADPKDTAPKRPLVETASSVIRLASLTPRRRRRDEGARLMLDLVPRIETPAAAC